MPDSQMDMRAERRTDGHTEGDIESLHSLKSGRGSFLFHIDLGVDFKNNQTTKQSNNSFWTNRKQVKLCFYLPIGPNKIV